MTTTQQIVRTHTLLSTLLDYLPGPSMMRVEREPAPSSDAQTRFYTPQERDAELARIAHQQRLRAGSYARLSDPWEHARREQYRQGDYAALDAAMRRLELEDAERHRLAWRLACGHPAKLDAGLSLELLRTLRVLAGWLPDPARVPAWAVRTDTSIQMIATLRGLGLPVAVISKVIGLPPGAVRRVKPAMREVVT